MSKDGYAWWKLRLRQMGLYFQAYRIDHILGFFRIWEIPGDAVTGLRGQFSPALPLWKSELESVGLWDFERLTTPYIRTHHLEADFGADYATKVAAYLENTVDNKWSFKADVNTEKKVAAALAKIDEDTKDLQATLFKYLNNVCLLHDKDGKGQAGAFHPRIEMMKSSNFIELEDEHVKNEFVRLYNSYFFEIQEDLWREKALEKLPAIKDASDMLVCGEDLGMVPSCVPGVMDALALSCLRIQRMPSDPADDFGNPAEYPELCVCTPSVHDTSTTRGWWEEDKETTQKYYNDMLKRSGEAPAVATPEIVEQIIEQHLESPCFWAVFPLQDFMGIDGELRHPDPEAERINIPAIQHHYWRYRMHMNISDLLANDEFNAHVKDLVSRTGRSNAY
jgi:4-alpha-glucanotransferase